MNGRRWASQIEDLIDLDEEREGDVVAQQLEAFVVEKVLDVASCAGKEVVDAEHLAAALKQPVGEVRPEEAGATRDENSSLEVHTATRLRGSYVQGPGLKVANSGVSRNSGCQQILGRGSEYGPAVRGSPVRQRHRGGDHPVRLLLRRCPHGNIWRRRRCPIQSPHPP